MDVAAWLRDLKLERYVSAFRDNDIDAEVLVGRSQNFLLPLNAFGRAGGARRCLIRASMRSAFVLAAALPTCHDASSG